MRYVTAFFYLLAFLGPISSFGQSNPLQALIESHADELGPWVKQKEKFQVQILYTQIDRDDQNQPSFTTYAYEVDDQLYFYPASTVKMPAAAVALEKINQLNINRLNKHCKMVNDSASAPQTVAIEDTSSLTGFPSVAHYVKKIFLV
ncbi:MAG: hypothetical protein AAFU03_16120, partial [Bacteroidota bacterium]